jgi:hypothetical protein
MATIEVNGRINRLFYENKGVEVVEAYKTKSGDEKERRYTVWLNTPTQMQIGDEVQVKGLFSAEVDEWTGKDGQPRHSVKTSINNPLLVLREPGAGFSPTHEELPF